ncbi:MAG TPA: hypothetical protein VIF57_23965 [Polyangia bacterium]|jgi:hypothetical protein
MTATHPPIAAPDHAARLAAAIRRRLLGVALRLLRQRTVQMFVADRPLAVATALCALVSLAPLFVTTFLPLVDIGSNIGAAALLDDVAFRHGIAAARYRVNWTPLPYWSGWSLMCLSSLALGPFLSAKVIVALGVLLVPLAVMRLLLALGRSPRLGLWAFLLAWDTNLYWGWVTFQIGVPAALWLLAWLIETNSWRGVVRCIPLSMFVALSHPHAVALLGVGALFQALVRPNRARALGQAALALAGVAILIPWLVGQIGPGTGELHVEFDPLPDRLRQFFRFTLDVITSKGGATVTSLVFVLFIVGPPAIAAMRPVETPRRSGALALALVLAPAVLYLALPFAISGAVEHWWTYPRYATYVLLGLLLLPAPDLRGRRALALAPGLVLLVGLSVARIEQFASYDATTRPYLDIIAEMKPGSSFLPLDMELSWPGTREASLGQLHGYAAAARSAYDPHLFDNPNMPLLYRHAGEPPQVDWFRLPESFSFERQGRYYDYIIIHPLSRDPLLGYRGRGVEWLRDAGTWRLYGVGKR